MASRSIALAVKAFCFAFDVAAGAAALIASLAVVRSLRRAPPSDWVEVSAIVVFVCSAAFAFWLRGVHRQVWRHASLRDLLRLSQAVALTYLIASPALIYAKAFAGFELSAIPASAPLWIILMVGARMLARARASDDLAALFRSGPTDGQPALIVGPADRVADAIAALWRSPEPFAFRPIGIVESNSRHIGRDIGGVQVMGGLDQLDQLFQHYTARYGERPMIALAAAPDDRATMDAALAVASARTATLLRLASREGRAVPRQIRPADLLARAERHLEREPIARLVTGSRVLITGGGGTIGGELALQCAALRPAQLAIFDASEFNLFEIDNRLREAHPDIERRMIIGDVRDAAALAAALEEVRPDVVIHAAALKHVPLAEANAREAVLTNLGGLCETARRAAAAGVSHFTFISTDKAVSPSSMMGASKRAAELFLQRFAAEAGAMRISIVRFGNVLGSKGSVAPLFEQQIEAGGPVTLTHPDMTRYFMSVEEAAALTLQAAALSSGRKAARASVFVLDMGEPVRVMDLAQRMIRMKGLVPGSDIPIRFTGIRPGEKLHEKIFYDGETVLTTGVEGVLEAVDLASTAPASAAFVGPLLAAASDRTAAFDIARFHQIAPEVFTDPVKNLSAAENKADKSARAPAAPY
jgi:O-antigen biosynthesis protein WbqV